MLVQAVMVLLLELVWVALALLPLLLLALVQVGQQ